MIEDLVFDGEVVVGDDFSGRRVGQFTAVGSSFTGCSFAGVEIGRAGFGAGTVTSTYVGCRFDRAKIACGPGGYARFVDCSFRDVDLRDWLCFAV